MTHPATPTTDRELVAALLRALDDGPVVLEHDTSLAAQGLASAYWPADGRIALNPAATPERQAEGLMHALEHLGRPALRLIRGGAS